MVSSIDLQALNDALFEGQSINPYHFGVPGTPSHQEIDILGCPRLLHPAAETMSAEEHEGHTLLVE